MAMLDTGRTYIGSEEGKASLTLYRFPYTSQHRHFSPEDGDSMFLRNVGIYLRIYTASKTQNIVILPAVRTSNLICCFC
jgi:hypothetical protein